MGTDKTDSLKTKNQVPLLSVLVVLSVVKISSIQEFLTTDRTDGHG